MIARIWRGWTKPADADDYLSLLRNEVLPGIAAKRIAGYRGATVMRREAGDEIEFVTVLRFESLDDVRRLAGPEAASAYVPAAARALLIRFEPQAAHYELLDEPETAGPST